MLTRAAKRFPKLATKLLRLDALNDSVINGLFTDYRAKSSTGNVFNFHFDSLERDKIINLIPIAMQEKTLRDAEGIMSYQFCFQGISQTFVDRIDWFVEPGKNKNWRWDINHHSFLLTLARAYLYSNNPKYIDRIYEVVVDWLKKNPLNLNNPNWNEPFEVAARLNNWIWLFYLINELRGVSPLLLKILLEGIYQHGSYLFLFMEIHIPNNHLLLETKTLYEASLLFPFPLANKWRKKAFHYLLREFTRQVKDDGGHTEQSTTYHRIINSEVLEVYALALKNEDSQCASLFEAPLMAMSEFFYSMIRPDGSSPVIGDATSVDTHYRFNPFMIAATVFDRPKYKGAAIATGEEDLTYFILGSEGIRKYNSLVSQPILIRSLCFPVSGYYFMQDESLGLKAVIDCGPFCDDKIPAHGHDDILSFELSLNNSLLIVDSGNVGSPDDAPEANNWREYFRGARSHNVLVLNHSNRSDLIGYRDVLRVARPLACEWHTTENVDYFSGTHDGYLHSFGVIHQREIILVKRHFFCVLDRLIGDGEHQVEILYHLAPDKKATINQEGSVQVYNATNPYANITIFGKKGVIKLVRGESDPMQGWVSFESGLLTMTDVVSFSAIMTSSNCIGTLIQSQNSEVFEVEAKPSSSNSTDNPQTHLIFSGSNTLYELSSSPKPAHHDLGYLRFHGRSIFVERHETGDFEVLFENA